MGKKKGKKKGKKGKKGPPKVVLNDDDLNLLLLCLQIESKAQAISFYRHWCKEQRPSCHEDDMCVIPFKSGLMTWNCVPLRICAPPTDEHPTQHVHMKALGGHEQLFEYSYGPYVFVDSKDVPGYVERPGAPTGPMIRPIIPPGTPPAKNESQAPQKSKANAVKASSPLSKPKSAENAQVDEDENLRAPPIPTRLHLSQPNLGLDDYDHEKDVSGMILEAQTLLQRRRELQDALLAAERQVEQLRAGTSAEVLAQVDAQQRVMENELVVENSRHERIMTRVTEHHQEVVLQCETNKEASIRTVNSTATELEISQMTAGHGSIVNRNKRLKRELAGVRTQASAVERQVEKLERTLMDLQERAFIMFDANNPSIPATPKTPLHVPATPRSTPMVPAPMSPQRSTLASPPRLTPSSPPRLTPSSPQRIPPSSPQRIAPSSPQRIAPETPLKSAPATPQKPTPGTPQKRMQASPQAPVSRPTSPVQAAPSSPVRPGVAGESRRLPPLTASPRSPARATPPVPGLSAAPPTPATPINPNERRMSYAAPLTASPPATSPVAAYARAVVTAKVNAALAESQQAWGLVREDFSGNGGGLCVDDSAEDDSGELGDGNEDGRVRRCLGLTGERVSLSRRTGNDGGAQFYT